MDILAAHLNITNLAEDKFDEHHPDTVVHFRILVWRSNFEKGKSPKKETDEELMLVA